MNKSRKSTLLQFRFLLFAVLCAHRMPRPVPSRWKQTDNSWAKSNNTERCNGDRALFPCHVLVWGSSVSRVTYIAIFAFGTPRQAAYLAIHHRTHVMSRVEKCCFSASFSREMRFRLHPALGSVKSTKKTPSQHPHLNFGKCFFWDAICSRWLALARRKL